MIAGRTYRGFGLTMLLSALVTSLTGGCVKTSEMKQYDVSVEQTKRLHQSSEVAAAVLPLFAKYKPDAQIPNAEIPQTVLNLPVFSSDTNDLIAMWNGGCTNGIMFLTGGGIAHWGNIVCPAHDPQQKRVVSTYGRQVEVWGDGVYFYHD